MEQNYNPLIVITTFNQLATTKRCIESVYHEKHDILVIDDCSTDGTANWLMEQGVDVYGKLYRRGLTDSWNIAYEIFKKERSRSHLILCNNDVIIPAGAIDGLMSDHVLTVPMTNHAGAGYVNKDQSVDFYLDCGNFDPGYVQYTQRIQNITKRGFKQIKHWTGFCMCFTREIISYEREDGNLFNPATINVGNDDDLSSRVDCRLALGSFIYHSKGISFNKTIKDRDDLRKTYK